MNKASASRFSGTQELFVAGWSTLVTNAIEDSVAEAGNQQRYEVAKREVEGKSMIVQLEPRHEPKINRYIRMQEKNYEIRRPLRAVAGK